MNPSSLHRACPAREAENGHGGPCDRLPVRVKHTPLTAILDSVSAAGCGWFRVRSCSGLCPDAASFALALFFSREG